MQHFLSRMILFISTGLIAMTAYATAGANLPYGVISISQQDYNLHRAAFYVCCAIGTLTLGVLFYSLIQFRQSKGVDATHFHEHWSVEIIWTVIPTLILIALVIPAAIVLKNLDHTDVSKPALAQAQISS